MKTCLFDVKNTLNEFETHAVFVLERLMETTSTLQKVSVRQKQQAFSGISQLYAIREFSMQKFSISVKKLFKAIQTCNGFFFTVYQYHEYRDYLRMALDHSIQIKSWENKCLWQVRPQPIWLEKNNGLNTVHLPRRMHNCTRQLIKILLHIIEEIKGLQNRLDLVMGKIQTSENEKPYSDTYRAQINAFLVNQMHCDFINFVQENLNISFTKFLSNFELTIHSLSKGKVSMTHVSNAKKALENFTVDARDKVGVRTLASAALKK